MILQGEATIPGDLLEISLSHPTNTYRTFRAKFSGAGCNLFTSIFSFRICSAGTNNSIRTYQEDYSLENMKTSFNVTEILSFTEDWRSGCATEDCCLAVIPFSPLYFRYVTIPCNQSFTLPNFFCILNQNVSVGTMHYRALFKQRNSIWHVNTYM